MTDTIPMLRCEALTVAYGDHVAARDISFAVGRGEIFGLLGPNGAGKTSVIRALTTILAPTSGSAWINGAPLNDASAIRRVIGVLPESNGYPSAQTGPGYLRYYGELFGLTRAEADRRAERLLGQLGLAGVTAPIGTYSRGMRQRLGLCRSLINHPVVLFLDEPTLGLDPAGKEEIITTLADIAASDGVSVILCTHLLDEVERVCDRVAILDHAEMVITGTVDEVIAAASLGGTARVRVAALDDLTRADHVLRALPCVSSISFDNARPGDLDLTLDPAVENASVEVLGALARASIEVQAFDRDRGSLNDAFLALTTGRDQRKEAA